MKFRALNESEYDFISYSPKTDSFRVSAAGLPDAVRKVAEIMSRSRRYKRYKPLDFATGDMREFLEYFSFDYVEEDGVEIWRRI